MRWEKVTPVTPEGGGATVTLKVPVATLPTLSVAVTLTVVVPTGKVLPLAGVYASVGVPPMLSVALAPLNVTLAPLADVALTLTAPGTLTTGGLVSTMPPPESVPLPLPEDRPRAKRKPKKLIARDGESRPRYALRA